MNSGHMFANFVLLSRHGNTSKKLGLNLLNCVSFDILFMLGVVDDKVVKPEVFCGVSTKGTMFLLFIDTTETVRQVKFIRFEIGAFFHQLYGRLMGHVGFVQLRLGFCFLEQVIDGPRSIYMMDENRGVLHAVGVQDGHFLVGCGSEEANDLKVSFCDSVINVLIRCELEREVRLEVNALLAIQLHLHGQLLPEGAELKLFDSVLHDKNDRLLCRYDLVCREHHHQLSALYSLDDLFSNQNGLLIRNINVHECTNKFFKADDVFVHF
mmetsp:Transcript_7519/g.14653  ORF Transcript_7519/g.14653 Transcript_7519/m.14653 type:complete len:267 (+) Transcript_7519:577-1377(+)